jgi:hypothetical protein
MADSPTPIARSIVDQKWRTDGWPLLQKFCLDCHNAEFSEAELDLSSYDSLDAMTSGAGSMQRVLEMIRFGAMPPEDSELPSEDERKRLVACLDQSLYSVSCDLRTRPGKVTARRLNRTEYNRTVRDLFGLDRFKENIQPADRFPSDEVGAGFDNNGDVLSMSPILMEKYLAAAETIASRVVIDPQTLPKIELQRTADQFLIHGKIAIDRFRGLCFTPETTAWARFDTSTGGDYELTIHGGSRQQKNRQSFVIYDAQGKLICREMIGYFGGRAKSQQVSISLNLSAGHHELFLRMADDQDQLMAVGHDRRPDRVQLDDDIRSKAEAALATPRPARSQVDPNEFPLLIRKLTLSGPKKFPANVFPPTQFEIVRQSAKQSGSGWQNVRPAARQCLSPLIERAFRRPVDSQEVDPYVTLVEDATKRGESYHRGIQIAVTAILVSPNFLFRIETPPEHSHTTTGPVALTQHQLASRLSYFLFSSMPDWALIDAANRGELKGDRVQAEVQRMLSDSKSESLASEFAAQWLGLRNLEIHEADTEQFPTYSPKLVDSMFRETELLFSHVVSENRPIVELLTADYSFINRSLAAHYGIDCDADGDHDFVRVSMADSPRRGLLSHASILTLTSNPGRTSPVKRGKWILENVLGTPPPDPPPGVPELEQTKPANENASLRDQLELHRADPSCAACHRVMDQLGFGLEQYDAVGQFRRSEHGTEIDSTGELPGGRHFDGGRELSGVLGTTEVDAFARTVASRLLTFALGRQLSPGDRCVIDEIVQNTESRGYRLQDLIIEVVKSRPFQFYDWDDVSVAQPANADSIQKR